LRQYPGSSGLAAAYYQRSQRHNTQLRATSTRREDDGSSVPLQSPKSPWQIDPGTLEPYHPVLTLKPFSSNLWMFDSKIFAFPIPMLMFVVNFPTNVRTWVVKLKNGDVLLMGPCQFTDGLQKELSEVGPVKHLVSPNAMHWMWVEDWKAVYPEATFWAPYGAKEYVQMKMDKRAGKHVGPVFQKEVGDPGWPAEIELVHFPLAAPDGTPYHETVYYHVPSQVAIVIDLCIWYDMARMSGMLFKFFMKQAGLTLEG